MLAQGIMDFGSALLDSNIQGRGAEEMGGCGFKIMSGFLDLFGSNPRPVRHFSILVFLGNVKALVPLL